MSENRLFLNVVYNVEHGKAEPAQWLVCLCASAYVRKEGPEPHANTKAIEKWHETRFLNTRIKYSAERVSANGCSQQQYRAKIQKK